MSRNIGKYINKNSIGKYSQKIVDHGKQSAIDALKTVYKRAIQKTAEATGDLIRNKIADKIARVSKTSPRNNSETSEEVLKKKCIYPKLRKKAVDDLKLKEDWYNNI